MATALRTKIIRFLSSSSLNTCKSFLKYVFMNAFIEEGGVPSPSKIGLESCWESTIDRRVSKFSGCMLEIGGATIDTCLERG